MNNKEKQKNEQEALSSQENIDYEVRNIAILSYVIFFLPYLTKQHNNSFVMFHANQGFIIFLLFVFLNIISVVIPFFGQVLILPLGYLFCLGLLVIGALHAWEKKKVKLPIIGEFDLLK